MTLDELIVSHPPQFGIAFVLVEPTVEGLVVAFPTTISVMSSLPNSGTKNSFRPFYQVYEELKSEPGVYVGTGKLTDEELDSDEWEALGYIKLRDEVEYVDHFHARKIVKL